MPKKQIILELTPKDVAPHAYQWDREQLTEMKAIIDGLLAAQDSFEPQEDEAHELSSDPGTESLSRGKRGGGYIERKTINGCGPYRYLRYWHQGKRKSVYVGKVAG